MHRLDCPQPTDAESYEAFAIRAHHELKGSLSDPEERNLVVEELWRDRRGLTPAEQMCADKIDPERYEKVPNVCYFIEHETTDTQGNPRKYTAKDLAEICQHGNYEIADVGAFPTIADRHNTKPGDPNPVEPKTLGLIGGYRLGMVGRLNPRWAVFADEYRDKTKLEELRDKPRRSVELWSFPDGRRKFDPVAALGSRAPRLALPMQFQLEGQAGTVERYSYDANYQAAASPAATFPGGANTFIPSTDDDSKKEQYEMLSPEDLAQVMAALQETPLFKKLEALVDGGGEPHSADAPSDPPADPPAAPPADPPADPAASGDASGDDLDALLASLEGDDETPDEYQQRPATQRDDGVTVEQYQQLQDNQKALMQRTARQDKVIAALAREREESRRTSALHALSVEYPGAFDLDEEKQTCLYSAGSQMDAQAFDQHLATISRFAKRTAVNTPMVPAGVGEHFQMPTEEAAQYEQQISERAVELATMSLGDGRVMSWDAAQSQARKEITGQ